MSASQRISRVFHRKGLLLAAITLIVGVLYSAYATIEFAPIASKYPLPRVVM